MVKEYTGRYKGFQIRDVAYLGEPPTDIPPTFDVVRWGYYDAEQVVKTPDGKVTTTVYDVENWIIKWCDYKLQELYED